MGKENPLISIIIPNYNNAGYLEACIDSVLRQTYVPKEIIVVDDCSTDNSREILAKYQKEEQDISLILLSENKGVSNARNEGVRKSNAEYITFLDADDFYVNPLKLENEMKLLLQQEEKGILGVSFSKLIAVGVDGKFRWEYKTRNQFLKKDIMKCMEMNINIQLPRDYCMKKQWFEESGGFEYGCNLYEDTDYLMRISKIADFYCTGELGSAYRITNNGLSSANREQHKAAIKRMRKRYKNEFTAWEWRKIQLVYGLNLLKDALKQRCKKILLKLKLWKEK